MSPPLAVLCVNDNFVFFLDDFNFCLSILPLKVRFSRTCSEQLQKRLLALCVKSRDRQCSQEKLCCFVYTCVQMKEWPLRQANWCERKIVSRPKGLLLSHVMCLKVFWPMLDEIMASDEVSSCLRKMKIFSFCFAEHSVSHISTSKNPVIVFGGLASMRFQHLRSFHLNLRAQRRHCRMPSFWCNNDRRSHVLRRPLLRTLEKCACVCTTTSVFITWA